MKRHVLIGNGVNIEFSGTDEYKNYAILDRMRNNLEERDRYTDVFAGKVTADDMAGFLDKLADWFKKHVLKGVDALKWTDNIDEILALVDMSKRYSKTDPDVLDIGMEDYLLALKLFNASFGDDALDFNSLYQGITTLFLDSIYNNGKIEDVYNNMGCWKSQLNEFDSVFTVNYDTNLDKIYNHPVFHLHGSFSTLNHEYRADTIKGWLILQTGKQLLPYINGKEYLFCDAVFGFSGQDKLERINKYNFPYYAPELEDFRNAHPELDCPAYPIREFCNIDGELDVIGLSPNNDSHIFNMINQNSKIQKVVYFSASDDDGNRMRSICEKPLEIADVHEYWSEVRR